MSTIPLIYGRIIAAAASRNSADSRRVLDGTGVNWKTPEDWNRGITLQEYQRILRNAVLVSGEKTILLEAGAGMPLTAHGVLGNAIGCSPDRMTTLRLLTRFIKLRGFFCNVRLESAGRKTRFYLHISEELGPERELALDFILGSLLNSLLFKKLLPIARPRIRLNRPIPAEDQYYGNVLDASMQYEQAENCILFDTADLKVPLPAHDPDQYDVAVKRCRTLLVDELKVASRRDAIERVFEQSPGLLWNIQQVATALHTSSRTLQRRLRNEGTTYQEVMDNWLAKLALTYIEKEKLSVESTATLLGYQDEANFRRAFKRWHGCSPRTWRQRLSIP